MELKEALMSGETTAEELLAQFKKELYEAQKEIEAEKAAAEEEDLEEARLCLVESILDYLCALGVVEEDDITDEEIDKLEKAISEAEEQFKNYTKIMESLKQVEHHACKCNKNDEDKLKDFLKTIM